jgi:hypothetical protein
MRGCFLPRHGRVKSLDESRSGPPMTRPDDNWATIFQHSDRGFVCTDRTRLATNRDAHHTLTRHLRGRPRRLPAPPDELRCLPCALRCRLPHDVSLLRHRRAANARSSNTLFYCDRLFFFPCDASVIVKRKGARRRHAVRTVVKMTFISGTRSNMICREGRAVGHRGLMHNFRPSEMPKSAGSRALHEGRI